MSKDPIDVSEKLGVYLNPKNATKDVREFAKELEADFQKYCHQNYDHFSVVLVLEEGKPVLNFMGYRKETPDETKKRAEQEEKTQQRVEAAELREYLRLKGKYGKKGE
jgi:hypothetical protein